MALGFAQFDRRRAWVEIETLLSAQWEDGFVPHIIFHKPDDSYFPGPSVWQTQRQPGTSGITQPPVAASIVRQLWNSGGESDKPYLEKLYPKLLAWHEWFSTYRDPLNQGLVMVTHPWETGRDNSPEWDTALASVDTSQVGEYTRRDLGLVDQSQRPTDEQYDRYLAMVYFGRECAWDQAHIATNGPFRVIDVGMSLMLLRANRDLLALANYLGKQADAAWLQSQIEKSVKGMDTLWCEKAQTYCSLNIDTHQHSSLVTNTSFLAFYADVGNAAQRKALINHLNRIKQKTAYLIPSTDPEHPDYDPVLYWRGPIWLVVNFMVAQGLLEQGYDDLASAIDRDSIEVAERGDFFESFSPETGRGTGGKQFSWSAAVWLHLNSQRSKEA